MKLTRAYFEGFLEGRFGNISDTKCPHSRTASVNEWDDGWRRGLVLRHLADGTVPARGDIAAELIQVRKQRGERV